MLMNQAGSKRRVQRLIFRACAIAARVLLVPIARLDIPAATLPSLEKGMIIAANHRSFLDLPVGLVVFSKWDVQPYIFVRGDYCRIPVLGALLRSLGAIPAGHGSSAAGRAREVLDSGGALAITPEGRIPRAGERVGGIADVKPGVGYLASALGSPILLVAITGTDTCWSLGRKLPRIHVFPPNRPVVKVSYKFLAVQAGSSGPDIAKDVQKGLSGLLAGVTRRPGSQL